jgi:hypothetical protein
LRGLHSPVLQRRGHHGLVACFYEAASGDPHDRSCRRRACARSFFIVERFGLRRSASAAALFRSRDGPAAPRWRSFSSDNSSFLGS